MKSITKLCGALALGLSLAACGGIEQTTLDAGPLMYGQLAQFTVQGPNLDKGITLVAPKCSGITEIAGSTPNLRAYNCTPTASGSITVTVVGGNVVLRDGKFDIDDITELHIQDTISELLGRSTLLANAVKAGKLGVVGANYRLTLGEIHPIVIIGDIN